MFTRLLNYRRDGALFDNVLQGGSAARHARRGALPLRLPVGRHRHASPGSTRTPRPTPRPHVLAAHARARAQRPPPGAPLTELGEGAAGVPLVERLVAISRALPARRPRGRARPGRAAQPARVLLQPWRRRRTRARAARTGPRGGSATTSSGRWRCGVHELAAVSRRCGALAGPRGDVVISWGYPLERGRPRIAFRWDETGPEGRSARAARRPLQRIPPGGRARRAAAARDGRARRRPDAVADPGRARRGHDDPAERARRVRDGTGVRPPRPVSSPTARPSARNRPPSTPTVWPVTKPNASFERTHHDARDVLDRADPAERRQRRPAGRVAVGLGGRVRSGLDGAGRDAVHADRVRAELERRALGQRLDRPPSRRRSSRASGKRRPRCSPSRGSPPCRRRRRRSCAARSAAWPGTCRRR